MLPIPRPLKHTALSTGRFLSLQEAAGLLQSCALSTSGTGSRLLLVLPDEEVQGRQIGTLH